ncbi:MAG: ribonuclease P protein component [Planctomycetia bacterium]|nr:ribonuclease P protein component [Planctomycetia bacterium]
MARAAGSAGFPRAARLLLPGDFARVFAVRRSAASGPLVLYACPALSAAQPARLGLSVSSRIGNAVVRNRWKRRLREAFRQVRARAALPHGNDFVIVVRSGAVPAGAAGARQVEEMICDLAARVVARPAYAAAAAATRQGTAPQPTTEPPRRRR